VIRDAFVRAFSRLVVGLRWLIVPAWIAAALASIVYLPSLGAGEPLALGGLVPDEAEAIRVGQREAELFKLPITADTVVVQRKPDGLPGEAQARAVARALQVSKSPQDPEGIAFALPISNVAGLFPGSRERGTTVLTYLFFGPDASLVDRVVQADRFAAQIPPEDGLIGVTGPAPARYRQFQEIDSHLELVEAATVAVILVVVGLTFKALGAPLLTLFAAAIAFMVSGGLIPWVGDRLGVTVPEEVEPLVVALTLGIATDYAVFYLAAYRRRLLEGLGRVEAAREATIRVTPIVATAGLIVVAGTAALLVGELEFFRAFGPALALTAAVSLVVSVTLMPALLAILGWRVFWPGVRADDLGTAHAGDFASPAREAATRFVTSRPVSILLVLVCGGVLVFAATGLMRTELALGLISGLPSDTEEQEAGDAAARGFAPGVLSPTVLLVQGGGPQAGLVKLEQELGEQEGVAAVLGPREQLAAAPDDLFVDSEGRAARFAIFFEESPLGSEAIHDLHNLEDRLPALLKDAGLEGVTAGLGGQTALASQTVEAVVGSSVRVGTVVLAVNFILLALFLRALIAPIYLLAASVLSVAATLGLTTLVFQDFLGHGDLTYYIPFAAGVLLVSLGSDYNVYVVGRIWDELRERPLREAVAVAVPRASKAISIAGIALAGSFAVLALVPLDAFREFAFMMTVGVLLETFFVRPLLIPALISVFGETSMWPGRVPPAAEPERAPAD
jgi:putative drug exporter of the RND superfamily